MILPGCFERRSESSAPRTRWGVSHTGGVVGRLEPINQGHTIEGLVMGEAD